MASSLTFRLGGDTRDAVEKLSTVSDRLDKLTKFAHSVKLDADDLDAVAKLKDVGAKLDKLSRITANPRISVRGIDRADLDLDRLELKLRDLGNTSVNVGGNSSTNEGTGLLSKVPGVGEAMPYGIGAIAALAASLIPSLVPLALSAAGGGGAVVAALGLSKHTQKLGGNVLSSLEQALLAGLTAPGNTGTEQRIGNRVGGDIPTPSALQSINGLLKQISQFVTTLGPGLGQMFRASIPSLTMFVKLTEQAARQLLPVFTQDMREFQPYLPEMAKGLGQISVGLAAFLKFLGPGMKDSSIIFLAVMKGVTAILESLSLTFSAIAVVIVKWAENVERQFTFVKSEVTRLWDETWGRVVSALTGWISRIIGNTQSIPHRILASLGNTGSLLLGAGKAIIDGLLNGINSASGGLLSRVEGIANDISGAFAHVLSILSPSRVFMSHGQNIVRGLVMGLDTEMPSLRSAMNRVSAASMLGGTHTAAMATAGTGVQTVQLEWVGGSGADAEFITWLKRQIRIRGGNPKILGA